MPSKIARTEYTETEAAGALGITVEELRTLVWDRVMTNDEHLGANWAATLTAVDLLLLRLLARNQKVNLPEDCRRIIQGRDPRPNVAAN